MVSAKFSSSLLCWSALLPVIAVLAVWLKEAAWFEAFRLSDAWAIAGFVLGTGILVQVLSTSLLLRPTSWLQTLLAGLLLGLCVLLLTRQATIELIANGYNSEFKAYSALLPLVASKRGLLYVLSLASVPISVATFNTLIRFSGQRTRVAAPPALAAFILVVSAYVASA